MCTFYGPHRSTAKRVENRNRVVILMRPPPTSRRWIIGCLFDALHQGHERGTFIEQSPIDLQIKLPGEQLTHCDHGFTSIGPDQFGQGLQGLAANPTPMNADIDFLESQDGLEPRELHGVIVLTKHLSVHLGGQGGEQVPRFVCYHAASTQRADENCQLIIGKRYGPLKHYSERRSDHTENEVSQSRYNGFHTGEGESV